MNTDRQNAVPMIRSGFLAAVLLATIAFAEMNAQVSAQPGEVIRPLPEKADPTVGASVLVVDTMLRMAGVRATDFLIDLGSGDGRVVINAAKAYGARGFGVDRDPRWVSLANENARREGVDDRIKFIQQDPLKTDLGSATVVTMHAFKEQNMQLLPRLFSLKPGTRIVTRDWSLGGWEADARLKVPASEKPSVRDPGSWISVWVVPAKVGGVWRSQVPTENGWADIDLKFDQTFQKISGEATVTGQKIPMERAGLSGDFVSFRIQISGQTILFNGYVQNGRIVGQVMESGGRVLRWRALRARG
jgi:predicted O-methyltransferase YrrM